MMPDMLMISQDADVASVAMTVHISAIAYGGAECSSCSKVCANREKSEKGKEREFQK